MVGMCKNVRSKFEIWGKIPFWKNSLLTFRLKTQKILSIFKSYWNPSTISLRILCILLLITNAVHWMTWVNVSSIVWRHSRLDYINWQKENSSYVPTQDHPPHSIPPLVFLCRYTEKKLIFQKFFSLVYYVSPTRSLDSPFTWISPLSFSLLVEFRALAIL